MSILSSGSVRVAIGSVAASTALMMGGAEAAGTMCDLGADSIVCISRATAKLSLAKKAGLTGSGKEAVVRVAALGKTGVASDMPATRKTRKLRKSRRNVKRHRRSSRRLHRRRRAANIRTIGRRPDRLNVRSLAGRSRRSAAARRAHSVRTATTRKGWRRRSRSLGYSVTSRSVVTSCFPARLKGLLNRISRHYGRKVRITSGFRSARHNRRIGGARRSQHLNCKAADFYVPGVNKYALARYVKSLPGRGGVGTYCATSTIHLDVGPRRSWHWGCGRRHGHRHYARRHHRRHARRHASRKAAHRRRYARARLRGSRT